MSELTSSLSSEGKMSAIMFRASSIKILSRLGSGLSVGDLKYQNLKRVLNSFNYLKNKTLVFHNKATRNKNESAASVCQHVSACVAQLCFAIFI
jgi:hypothetical protein